MTISRYSVLLLFALTFFHMNVLYAQSNRTKGDHPRRIINIVNFIRLLEPRDSAITQEVLYQTVVKQIALMKKHHVSGTFLLQYEDQFEIGAWWELPQPL